MVFYRANIKFSGMGDNGAGKPWNGNSIPDHTGIVAMKIISSTD